MTVPAIEGAAMMTTMNHYHGPPRRVRDNSVPAAVFAVVISLIALPVIVVCAMVSMSIAGITGGFALLVSVVGGVVATGFLIPEIYRWMRRNI